MQSLQRISSEIFIMFSFLGPPLTMTWYLVVWYPSPELIETISFPQISQNSLIIVTPGTIGIRSCSHAVSCGRHESGERHCLVLRADSLRNKGRYLAA